MGGEQPPSVIDEICRIALPGVTLRSTDDRRLPLQACECVKHFLWSRAQQFIATANPHRILTRVMTFDETPLLLNKRFSLMMAGLRRIVRCGRETTNLLCEHTYFAGYDAEGRKQHIMHIEEPTVLTDGKAGWNLFACQLCAAPDPMHLNWRGPLLYHYVWDRGCFSFLDRVTRKYHEVQKQQAAAASPDARLAPLLTFVTTRADILHDVHNAGSWGFKEYVNDDQLKDLFVSVAAIRNSFADIMRYLQPWLRSAISFAFTGYSSTVLSRLWEALDVETDVASVLISYGILFKDDKLLADPLVMEEPDMFDNVCGA